ncbi:MAG: Holliday junction resolvase YqgF [Parcubacteria group bacterium GW2011_GWC2_38_7]|nr:MAG: Holliday junction resolvase YqgF [Parcubacteria group bacterium GW2011_GWC2_38_7]
MNCLGLDWGKSKLGVALGDDGIKIATPFRVIKFKTYQEAIQNLEKIISDEQIGHLVIGQPTNLAGEEFESVDFENFLTELKKLNLQINFEDERLTTKVAVKKNIERRNHRNEADDDLAAAEILQSYFDKL